MTVIEKSVLEAWVEKMQEEGIGSPDLHMQLSEFDSGVADDLYNGALAIYALRTGRGDLTSAEPVKQVYDLLSAGLTGKDIWHFMLNDNGVDTKPRYVNGIALDDHVDRVSAFTNYALPPTGVVLGWYGLLKPSEEPAQSAEAFSDELREIFPDLAPSQTMELLLNNATYIVNPETGNPVNMSGRIVPIGDDKALRNLLEGSGGQTLTSENNRRRGSRSSASRPAEYCVLSQLTGILPAGDTSLGDHEEHNYGFTQMDQERI